MASRAKKGRKKKKGDIPDPITSLDSDVLKDLAASLKPNVGPPHTKTPFPPGRVRASPYGACLDSFAGDQDPGEWTEWENENLKPLQVPKEGYGHFYGQETIDQVDGIDLGDGDTEEAPTGDPGLKNPHDFGSTKTPDDAPVGSLKDKWRLLPHFLKLRSLMKGYQ